ncbi:MAG: cytochrome d ubiquinol oxidase subunit II [Candidatus Eisenbacteria bacterium]
MSGELLLAGVLLVALALYLLGAGADFGGGIWDLLARGPTAKRQRDLIAHAIGPVWEANHVWLVLIVVVLFVGFPHAFSAMATALHLPLTLMLIGIVLRGSAFTFRTYDSGRDDVQRRWGRLFAIASVGTPFMLGVCAGAVSSGRLRVDVLTGEMHSDFITPWFSPFPFAIGAFALALCAFLAASYLTLETQEADLLRAFRSRALGAALACGVAAWGSLLLARTEAPHLYAGLMHRAGALPFQCTTGVVALAAIVALWRKRYASARMLAAAQVSLVVLGWGLAQYPYLIVPDLTLTNAAAAPQVLRATLMVLAVGALVLFPALGYLFMVFKRGTGRR